LEHPSANSLDCNISIGRKLRFFFSGGHDSVCPTPPPHRVRTGLVLGGHILMRSVEHCRPQIDLRTRLDEDKDSAVNVPATVSKPADPVGTDDPGVMKEGGMLIRCLRAVAGVPPLPHGLLQRELSVKVRKAS
jgi:hypothetical protein